MSDLTLDRLGAAGDDDIDIAEGALLLAAAARHFDLAPYRRHLAEIASTAARALDRESAAETDPRVVATALGRTFAALGYDGDRDTYDDLKNADLAYVIDRRRGLPVALGILFIHAARAIGATAHGLNFPGHFLVGLGTARGTVVIDPFHGGRLIDADDLERLGPPGAAAAETHLGAVADRAVLLRLQNNIVTRLAAKNDHAAVAAALEPLIRLAPDSGWHRYRLGAALAEAERPSAARAALKAALALDPSAPWAAEAEALAARLARSLN